MEVLLKNKLTNAIASDRGRRTRAAIFQDAITRRLIRPGCNLVEGISFHNAICSNNSLAHAALTNTR